MSYYYDSSSFSSSSNDSYSDNVSDDESSVEEMSFGEGIQIALINIQLTPQELKIMTTDAQIIQNIIMKTLCDHNPDFKKAFGGLSSADSFLDDIQFSLPDKYDLNIELRLPLFLQAVCAYDYSGFVFLHVIGGDYGHRCVQKYNGNYYINRLQLQKWLTNCLSKVMYQLAFVNVSRRRAYSLKYIPRGDGHSFEANETSGNGRRLCFNFVPSIKFAANQWPRGLKKVPNKNLDWYAKPRNYDKANCQNDSRSFIISAPHWENLALHNKNNLKNSLRLMKAFRQANEMHGQVNYIIKLIYLNEINKKPKSYWSQPLGELLICMMTKLIIGLLKNYIPFYLDPSHNWLDQLKESDRRQYLRKTSRCLKKLKRRQNANYLTDEDLDEFFGV